jgi:hypothetical protein
MWKPTIVLLLVALGCTSAPTRAQDATTTADVRCIIVGMRLAESVNCPQQSRGILLAWYYIGRLDGREPKSDIESLLLAVTAKMSDSDYVSEQDRCEAALADNGKQIIRIGQRLVEIDAGARSKANAK